MKQNRPYRIILSGGGTGGHIFPAIAIANGIRERMPEAEILFVGARGKMEMEKVPRAGYPITGLPITAFHRSLTWKNLLFPFRLLVSLLMAGRIIRRFRPDLVIGTGGFASGPVLRVATRRGIPTLLQEQNSFPGVTNRILAEKVNRICVAYEGMERYFPSVKIVLTGNPVRQGLIAPGLSRTDSFGYFGFDPAIPAVLVFGGSQGARTLNLTIAAHLKEIAASGVQMIWQTGVTFHETAKSLLEKESASGIRVFDFINEMDKAYSVADLVVCRSGAITLSELAIVGKPAILVPFPAAAADHQTKNARAFAEAGAAILVADKNAREQLVGRMLDLVGNRKQLEEMGARMSSQGKLDSTRTIIDEAFKLC
ncbi:MAG: undecaprenyldiphospho-muramoylpentapeptide beta-N-acetylglucosaminyltransferase [Bacteroidales bacterium]